MTQDEWRVEINLDDEEHGYTLRERLRAHDLDGEARERLGRRVIVTRDGPKVFLYATDAESAREAERVASELLDADRITAEVTVTRWVADAEEWIPVTGAGDSGEARAHPFDWEIHANLPSREAATELEHRLRAEGLPSHRIWRRVTVDARTAGEADECAERLRAELPPGTEVWVEPNPEGLPNPVFVWLETRV